MHLSLGGDCIHVKYIASWILERELLSGHYESIKYKTTIDILEMGAFLTSGTNPISLQAKVFFQLYGDAVSSLSEGVNLWEGEGSEGMQSFRKYVKANWCIIVTNTQLVEQWIKDSNECTHSGK